jgi:flavin-binding protein dodecin
MAIVKVLELLCESDSSWEDAARQAVANAAESVHDIRSIYVENFEAVVENNTITKWRINAKISFGVQRD